MMPAATVCELHMSVVVAEPVDMTAPLSPTAAQWSLSAHVTAKSTLVLGVVVQCTPLSTVTRMPSRPVATHSVARGQTIENSGSESGSGFCDVQLSCAVGVPAARLEATSAILGLAFGAAGAPPPLPPLLTGGAALVGACAPARGAAAGTATVRLIAIATTAAAKKSPLLLRHSVTDR